MNDFIPENGPLFVPTSEETGRYVACLRQICKRYNIQFSKATELEKNFVLASVEQELNNKVAV
ncbi:MAG: hypothetical protein IKX83_04980 [Clostridia bacterium]|nr:hypothetical protein [Clostridia bacterium]